jgi:hypothetical protein
LSVLLMVLLLVWLWWLWLVEERRRCHIRTVAIMHVESHLYLCFSMHDGHDDLV